MKENAMRDYFNLTNLPIIDTSRQVLQVSSFDRKEENADWENFLYTESDGTVVLLEEEGKGCVKSIWAAVTNNDCILSFYFDGEDTPRFTSPLKAFFNEPLEQFNGPAIEFPERGHFDLDDCHCGNCFYPIPFEKGLKITAKGNTHFYYHIMYEKYHDTEVSEHIAYADGQCFKDAFDGVSVPQKTYNINKEFALDNEYTEIFLSEKGGVITEFTVECNENDDLSDLFLEFFLDNCNIAYIAAPLLHFLVQPMGFTPIKTVAAETVINDGRVTMTLRLPIPFWSRASVELVNPAKDGRKITVKLCVEENNYDPKVTGYLHGDYRQGLTELYEDWLLGKFHGRGNVVGFVQTCLGGQWCEGNEHFYVNGAVCPQINGTGTEDFYLGCYWPNHKYDSPLAGCVNDVYEEGGCTLKGAGLHRAGYYRFMHDMPISFSDGIELLIQHGAVGQTFSDYTSLVFSYRRPEPALTVTDCIYLDSEGSKALHGYKSSGEAYTLCGKIEGERKAPVLQKSGYLHTDGDISMKASLITENNGIVIRRLFDKKKSPQAAVVYVDGEQVGIWKDCGFNEFAPFGDSDFYVPAKFTSGKSIIDIKLTPMGSFSDFEYKVLSFKKM